MWRAGLLKRQLGVFRVVQLAITTWNWLGINPNSETNQWWNSEEINLKTAMCYIIDGRLYINSSTQPGNGILMSGSQVTHLAELNEEPICRYLETKWDTRLNSTGSQIIENIKIRWGLNMRLRGVNINCELMREAQLYSQLHGELQRELSSQVTLSARRDLTR